MRGSTVVLWSLTLGCGGRAVQPGGEAGESSSSQSDSQTEDSGEGTSEEGTDGTDTGGEYCDPNGMLARFSNTYLDVTDEGQFDYPCEVTGQTNDANENVSKLDCMDADSVIPIWLEILWGAEYQLPLDIGDQVRLRFKHTAQGNWMNRIFRIEDVDGRLIAAGSDGDAINFQFDDGTWALPYEPESVDGQCVPEENGCGIEEKLAVAFTVDGEQFIVSQASHETLDTSPPVDVWATYAIRTTNNVCSNISDEWFGIIVAHLE